LQLLSGPGVEGIEITKSRKGETPKCGLATRIDGPSIEFRVFGLSGFRDLFPPSGLTVSQPCCVILRSALRRIAGRNTVLYRIGVGAMPQVPRQQSYSPIIPPATPNPGEPRFLEWVASACRIKRLAYRTEKFSVIVRSPDRAIASIAGFLIGLRAFHLSSPQIRAATAGSLASVG
jgi:hypothetical protein